MLLVHQGTKRAALHYAAQQSDPDVIKALVKAKADLNLPDSVTLLFSFCPALDDLLGHQFDGCDSVYAGVRGMQRNKVAGALPKCQRFLDAAVLMFSFVVKSFENTSCVVTRVALLGEYMSRCQALLMYSTIKYCQ